MNSEQFNYAVKHLMENPGEIVLPADMLGDLWLEKYKLSMEKRDE